MPFQIGPGVEAAMQAANDEPRTDESYITSDVSRTYGRDALYVYFKVDNVVRRRTFLTQDTMLDCQNGPPLQMAMAAAQAVGARVWGVYIGGPAYAGVGYTPAHVAQMAQLGLRFLPIYVGQQTNGELTAARGRANAADAIALLGSFGWGAGTPVCLDVEAATFAQNPAGVTAYAGAWSAAVRQGGFRPGVYGTPATATALDNLGAAARPEFVWIASWVRHAADPRLSLRNISGLSDELWSDAGQRAWQYAGDTSANPLVVAGLRVDISLTSVSVAAPE